MPEGLHIYGEPVLDGMVPTTIPVSGPTGLVSETWILLPTEPRKCDTRQAIILQADVAWNLSVQTAANAWSRSAMMSSICSMPIDRRT